MKKMGPLAADHPLVIEGEQCPGCKKKFAAGEYLTLVMIGPGDSEENRRKHSQHQPYNAVAVPVHWECAGGERDASTTVWF